MISFKKIQKAIFEVADISTAQERELLIRYLKFELDILKANRNGVVLR